jgi:hypothetical protein
MSPIEESRGFTNGEREAEKVSRGLVSGGDMRLETEGRRFMFGCLPEGQAAADEVISMKFQAVSRSVGKLSKLNSRSG